MRKKENWMFKGAHVIANGKPGTITKMQENKNLRGDGIDYVYYIDVRLDGQKHDGRYHPNDIAEAKVVPA